MKLQLEEYSIEDLKSLKKEVDEAISSFQARALANAREELEKTAKSLGFKLEDIIEVRKPRAKSPQNIVTPKNPSKPGRAADANLNG